MPLPVRILAVGAFDVQGLGPVRPGQLIRKVGELTLVQMESLEMAVKQWLELK